ncbi:MAG TPA: inositol monophosphatase family protein [Gemmatimonadaceae bacterium]|nr:inositol monophosphatase family protein [Gemmatimonadaceae bacterium]
MTEKVSSLLDAAQEVARIAGAIALEHFRSGIAAEAKADGSPVTAADRDAERAARTWIEQRFPQDGILGEEYGDTRPLARRRWVLDPIDGTRTFVRGVPFFGSLVAVLDGEEVLAGAAYFPALDELLCAAPGEGCWYNSSRSAVSGVSRVTDALVLCTDERFTGTPAVRPLWGQLADQAAMARTWGDCYGYLLVATGRAEVMVDPIMNPWDAACFLPIIEEAGGVLTDWKGRRTVFGGSTIATNKALAEVVRTMLAVDQPVGTQAS